MQLAPLVFLLLLGVAFSIDQEEITKDVVTKKKTFKCNFVLTSNENKMILKKSKVKCTPSKPKKQKVSNFEISGQFGLYKISFTINPSKITKALLTKEITTTTFSSTTDPTVPLTPSCGLGYSRICTIDMDGGCPQDMTRHCFGSSTQSDTDPQEVECGCLPTILLEDAIADSRNPLSSCSSPCLCIPSSLNSQCQTKSILITGGGHSSGDFATSEMYGGPVGCMAPSLPEPHRHHVTFITADGIVATCGGVDDYDASKCLILNEDQSWEEDPSKMGNRINPTWGADVVTLPVGVYILAGSASTSEFLPTGETIWQEGPTGHVGSVYHCAVAVSQTSFLVIGGGSEVREYDSSNSGGPTSNNGWKPVDTWPDLPTGKYFHACALYGDKVMVAGGGGYIPPYDVHQKSTHIIDLTTKTISQGPDMNTARGSFGLTSLGFGNNVRLLAFGGWNGQGTNDDVEELDMDTNTWTSLADNLMDKKGSFGYIAVTEEMSKKICEI